MLGENPTSQSDDKVNYGALVAKWLDNAPNSVRWARQRAHYRIMVREAVGEVRRLNAPEPEQSTVVGPIFMELYGEQVRAQERDLTGIDFLLGALVEQALQGEYVSNRLCEWLSAHFPAMVDEGEPNRNGRMESHHLPFNARERRHLACRRIQALGKKDKRKAVVDILEGGL